MIDIAKYTHDKDSIAFISMLYDSYKSSYLIEFGYEDKDYLVITKDGNGIDIYVNEKFDKGFEALDELLLKYKIGDKSLIELVDDLDFATLDE